MVTPSQTTSQLAALSEDPHKRAPSGVCSSMLCFFHLVSLFFFEKEGQKTETPIWAKVGLDKVGIGQSRPIRMAKVGLAKVGINLDLLLERPSQLLRPPGAHQGGFPPLQSAPLQAPPSRLCRCGRSLEVFGHHRAACSRAGVLGRRGFQWRVWQPASAEKEGPDLRPPNVIDSRRLEVVADELPLFGGVQLAVDTTLVSPLHCDGTARRHTAHVEGGNVPRIGGTSGRARLVVWAGEVNGRWSAETRTFWSLLAKAKARSETPVMRRRVEQAWRMRWDAMLACTAARAFAASLLNLRLGGGVDGEVPTAQEVVNEARYAGLRG